MIYALLFVTYCKWTSTKETSDFVKQEIDTTVRLSVRLPVSFHRGSVTVAPGRDCAVLDLDSQLRLVAWEVRSACQYPDRSATRLVGVF